MNSSLPPSAPARRPMLPIDPSLARPGAIVAAMMSAGYAAIALVAAGEAVWEDEAELALDPGLAAGARRRASIWSRAAETLEGGAAPLRKRCPRSPGDPGKGSPCSLRSDRATR